MSRPHEEIIGNSSTLAKALEHLSQLAPINRPVLIIGERGTGKELAADRLHYLSERWHGPMVKVNCAAISSDLLESELFGHEPGAFTGATRTHHGRFERADGGTLFLDELATMSYRLQEKLLRLIEYGEFERLGGQQTLQVDVRVVAATNANLPEMAEKGEFREDLLDRLSFDVVHLPPLRFRKDDIELLAQHFAIHICRELNWDYFAGFSSAAMEQLLTYHWPGNVRELKNVVERSIYRWTTPEVAVDEIIINPFDSPFSQPPATEKTEPQQSTQIIETLSDSTGDYTSLIKQFEIDTLTSALKKNNGHQGNTANMLGISYHQLRGLLRKYKISAKKSNHT